MWHEGAFFDLEYYGTLNTLEGVPYILGDVYTIVAIFMTEDDAVTDSPVIRRRGEFFA